MSDQSGLRYLSDQLYMISRQARWLAMINEFILRLGTSKQRRTWLHMILASAYS